MRRFFVLLISVGPCLVHAQESKVWHVLSGTVELSTGYYAESVYSLETAQRYAVSAYPLRNDHNRLSLGLAVQVATYETTLGESLRETHLGLDLAYDYRFYQRFSWRISYQPMLLANDRNTGENTFFMQRINTGLVWNLFSRSNLSFAPELLFSYYSDAFYGGWMGVTGGVIINVSY